MTFKYFYGYIALLFGIAFLTSCLNSNDNIPVDASPDAQLYNFSATSNYDSLGALKNAVFSIDQLNNKIYNQTPITFGFEPKNVMLKLGYAQNVFPTVEIHLSNPDSVYLWKQTDSVNIARLNKIVVTSENKANKKTYAFLLNKYLENPDILSWNKVSDVYIPKEATESKTVLYNNKIYTYYRTISGIKGVQSSDGKTNTAISLSGMISAIDLQSVKSTLNGIFALDTNDAIYKTTDGINWTKINAAYPVKSVFGILPSATNDSILSVVNQNGILKYAKTKDFTQIRVLDNVPTNLPLKSFSSVSLEDQSIYSTRFIIISGGKTSNNSFNEIVWMLQEDGNKINSLAIKSPLSAAGATMQASTLFLYDSKLYALCTVSTGKNGIIYSKNNGVTWILNDTNQVLPPSCPYRQYASIIVDSNNYIRLFGGKTATATHYDAWEEILNKYKK